MKRSETPSAARTVNVDPGKWAKWIAHCTPIYGSVSARVRQIMEADITGKNLGSGNEFTLEMLEQRQVNLVLEKRKLKNTFIEKNHDGKYIFGDRYDAVENICEEIGLETNLANLEVTIPKLLDYETKDSELKDDIMIFIRLLRVFKQLSDNKIALKAELMKKLNPEPNEAPKSDKDPSGKTDEESDN